MKITLRIPTADPYAYMEIETDSTPDEAMTLYQEVSGKVKGGEGLEPKAFNAILDELLTKKSISGDPGLLTEMSIVVPFKDTYVYRWTVMTIIIN